MKGSIGITGYGIICSIGTDSSTVLNSLKKKESGIGPFCHLTSGHKELPVGEVKMSNAELKQKLALPVNSEYSRTTLLGAYALRQTIDNANFPTGYLDGKRVVFISGTTVGGMDITELHYPHMQDSEAHAAFLSKHDCGSNTGEIAEICGLDCEQSTISTACSSALNAIILGTRILQAGEADIVIAGGTEALSRFHLNGFNSLLILDNENCRPFDATRRGLNLGEGAAYVVLEKSDEAQKRDARPTAYIAGYGNRCDAYHQTATSENGEGAFLSMSDAMKMSGLKTSDIDYINAHGTGTPDNDRSESAAVKRLFGESVPPISSTKTYTGHTTSASGSIETVICLIAMHNHLLPASLGWETKDENCITPFMGGVCNRISNVLCNSFGFGGNDSSLIISSDEFELAPIPESSFTVSGEYVVDDESQLAEVKSYVSAMELRRMSKIMKAAVLTSLRAMEQAGIDKPDAIVVATEYGMLEQGEKILDHIKDFGEEGISPTLFMQSTHNTIAGNLAIRFKCHGYNITYSHGKESFDWAVREAKRLISEGKANNVLVGLHDQCTPGFKAIFDKAGMPQPRDIYSKSIVITRK